MKDNELIAEFELRQGKKVTKLEARADRIHDIRLCTEGHEKDGTHFNQGSLDCLIDWTGKPFSIDAVNPEKGNRISGLMSFQPGFFEPKRYWLTVSIIETLESFALMVLKEREKNQMAQPA